MFEAESSKRKFDELSNTEEVFAIHYDKLLSVYLRCTFQIKPAFLSNIVLQFAHDMFAGNESATIPNSYMVLLKEEATTMLKFKLFLHAVKLLNQEKIDDQQSHIIK